MLVGNKADLDSKRVVGKDKAKAFAEKMTEAGVAAYDFDPTRIRMVTHLDVDAAAIDRAIDIVGKIASGPNS